MNRRQWGELMESLLHHCVGVWVAKCGTYLIPKVTADIKLTNGMGGWDTACTSESLKTKEKQARRQRMTG